MQIHRQSLLITCAFSFLSCATPTIKKVEKTTEINKTEKANKNTKLRKSSGSKNAKLSKYRKINYLHPSYQAMKNDGWTVVEVLGTTKKGHKQFIIVQIDIIKKWAIEVGIFSEFPRGEYWAKVALVDGLSEIIDADGREQSFLFAEKIRLR
jgi:hypothetical protein